MESLATYEDAQSERSKALDEEMPDSPLRGRGPPPAKRRGLGSSLHLGHSSKRLRVTRTKDVRPTPTPTPAIFAQQPPPPEGPLGIDIPPSV